MVIPAQAGIRLIGKIRLFPLAERIMPKFLSRASSGISTHLTIIAEGHSRGTSGQFIENDEWCIGFSYNPTY